MDILKILFVVSLLLFPFAELAKVQFNFISISLNDLILLVVFAVWVTKNRFKINFGKSELGKPIVLFASVAFLSLVLNLSWLSLNEFLISFLYLMRWVLYASVYFILLSFDKNFLNKLRYVLVIPIALFLLIGYVQFFFYQNLRNLYYLGWDEHLYRLFSSFLDPNFAGAFFVLTFIYLLHLVLINLKNKALFILLTSISILNLIAIYLTYSRSALIMLFVSLGVFLLLLNKKKFLFLTALGLILMIFISPKAFQTEGTNLLRVASSEARIQSAKIAADIFGYNPVTGVGFNSYRFAQHKYGYLTDEKWQVTHSGAGTDNSFLFILATTGVIGFGAYLYLISRMAKSSISKSSLISKMFLASLVGILISSLFVNSLFYVYIMQWIWITAAFKENN
jgi:O-antigen ligase